MRSSINKQTTQVLHQRIVTNLRDLTRRYWIPGVNSESDTMEVVRILRSAYMCPIAGAELVLSVEIGSRDPPPTIYSPFAFELSVSYTF